MTQAAVPPETMTGELVFEGGVYLTVFIKMEVTRCDTTCWFRLGRFKAHCWCHLLHSEPGQNTEHRGKLRAQSELTDWHTRGLIAIYATSGLEDSLHYCKTEMIIMIKSQQLMKY